MFGLIAINGLGGFFGPERNEYSKFEQIISKFANHFVDKTDFDILESDEYLINGVSYKMQGFIDKNSGKLYVRQVQTVNTHKNRKILFDQNNIDVYLSSLDTKPITDLTKTVVYTMTSDQIDQQLSNYIKKLLSSVDLKIAHKMHSNKTCMSKSAIFSIIKSYYVNYFTNHEKNIKVTATKLSRMINIKSILSQKIKNISTGTSAMLTVTPDAYLFKSDEIFVNFAATTLGGGVLGHGWVQEEFLTSCLSLLPFIGGIRNYYTNLNKEPVVFGTNAFFQPNLEFYGRKTGLIEKHETIMKNPENIVTPIPESPLIYWLSMSAINLTGKPKITDIYHMLELAINGYYLAILHLLSVNGTDNTSIINTGNWGAGAFGWDPSIIYLIQIIAFHFAVSKYIEEVGKSVPIRLHYHCYDISIFNKIVETDLSIFNDNELGSFIAFIANK